MHAGANSSGQYGDTFIGRIDYASASLFNRVPSAKFGGTDNKFSTQGILVADYNNPANITLRRAGTTPGGSGGDNDVYTDSGTPTGVLSGETIGIIYWQSLDDEANYSSQSSQGRSAQIACRATENAIPTGRGGALAFETTANGAQTPAERMRIEQDGVVVIGTNDASAARVLKFRDSGGSSLVQHEAGGALLFCTDNSDLSPGQGARLRVDATSLAASSALYTASDGKTLTTTAPSSSSYKDNIADFEPDVNRMFDLSLKTFTWKSTGEADCGFIAEDVEHCLPALFRRDANVTGWKADRFPLFLFHALKQLKRRVDAIERPLNAPPT